MKALIIEDEDHAAMRLIQLLKAIEPDVELEGPIDTVKNAVTHLCHHTDYDLLFLDIQLADGKSFSIFEKVKVNIPVIFTTAYDEYAIKAFELNSIDYLLKPINIDKLKTSLTKFREIQKFYSGDEVNKGLCELFRTLHSQQTKRVFKTRFLVNKSDSLLPIHADEIAYFFAEDKAVFLVTSDGKRYLISHVLEELEQKLDPMVFFRVNRQVLASVKAIRKVHNYFNYKLKVDLLPVFDEEVIVSKAKTGEFKAWMNGEGFES